MSVKWFFKTARHRLWVLKMSPRQKFTRLRDCSTITQNWRLWDVPFKIWDSEIWVKFHKTLKISGTICHPQYYCFNILICRWSIFKMISFLKLKLNGNLLWLAKNGLVAKTKNSRELVLNQQTWKHVRIIHKHYNCKLIHREFKIYHWTNLKI